MAWSGFDSWQGSVTALDVWSSAGLPTSVLRQRQSTRLAELLCWAVKHAPLYRGIAGRRDPMRLALIFLTIYNASPKL